MRRKYFFRRFRQYLVLFLLPVTLVVLLSLLLSFSRLTDDLERDGRALVNSVNTDLDLSLKNISQQNVQFANNPYMVLSLKRILENGGDLSYADSINIRSINATLKSTVSTYPYVKSVFLYLSHYDYYYSSGRGIMPLTGKEEWYCFYQKNRDDSTEIWIFASEETDGDNPRWVYLLQKMPFFDGIVVMKVDVAQFQELLDQAVSGKESSVVFFNMDGERLFTWGAAEDAVFLNEKDLPGDGKYGVWKEVGEGRYLLHQSNNENFAVQIVSMLPYQSFVMELGHSVPSAVLMLAAGIAAALLTAYITTMRNFGHIENMISVLSEAEQGKYPEKEEKHKPEDEYDAILNNIIRLHLETERLNVELQQKQHLQEVASLSALQAQINPHFMFNTLQMIQFKVAEGGQGQQDAMRMTCCLADILKYALADPLKPITLREEIENLKKYVTIQHMRFGEQFIIYYEVDEELKETPVFRLMLQPIIENSILHGIRYRKEKGYIKLTVFARGDRVRFRVFDTGIGMNREELEQLRKKINTFDMHNIGLANVNNRLKLYFGEDSGLRIHSMEGQGTIVQFEIPMDQIEKYATQS